jgi:hypothetical protein
MERLDPTLPFDTATIWEEAVCLNLRISPEALRPLVPSVFELDVYEGHAFVSLTASRLKNFGPASLPALLGVNFYQATYRAHVVYVDRVGRRRRGCYFVRSETNSSVMSSAANALPEFRAHRCATHPIVMAKHGESIVLTVDSGDDPAGKVVVVLDVTRDTLRMPAESAFASIGDARALLVDFDEAFAYEEETDDVLVLRIERGEWNLRVARVLDAYLGFVEEGPFPPGAATFDSAFYFRDVPYRWLPLVREKRSSG